VHARHAHPPQAVHFHRASAAHPRVAAAHPAQPSHPHGRRTRGDTVRGAHVTLFFDMPSLGGDPDVWAIEEVGPRVRGGKRGFRTWHRFGVGASGKAELTALLASPERPASVDPSAGWSVQHVHGAKLYGDGVTPWAHFSAVERAVRRAYPVNAWLSPPFVVHPSCQN